MLNRAVTVAGGALSNFVHLFRTSAPLAVPLHYASTLARYFQIKKRYRAEENDFREAMKAGRFSTDWFSQKIPFWLHTFQSLDLFRKDLDILEIGSWEGMSSCFILRTFPNARLTCVDTWQGSDEHVGLAALESIEAKFDGNTAPYKDRLTKRRQSSLAFFSESPAVPRFDLIHVDGSHHADDVVVDAVQSYARLKVGGVMILDDFLWRDYQSRRDNPAAAINAFLRLKAGTYEFVLVYYQVILRKLA
ncbi:MAG: class I SAM-dependent methyltransferase [Alphaproteobacteria bacterium]